MRGRGTRRSRKGGAVLAGVLAASLIAAACGSGTGSSKAQGSTTSVAPGTTASAPISKTLGTGVTAKTIKIGVALINYDVVKQYIHNTDGNQEQTYNVFINDINKHGGVDGRQLVPVYYTYAPVPGLADGPETACTSLTEDSKVFATIGVLYDATGAAQLCFTNQHHSILITHELTQAVISKATPGLMLTVSATPEADTTVLLTLLKKYGTLKGKTVAALGETANQSDVTSTIVPGLKSLGIKTGTTAILSISTEDTTAAQNQLDSFIQRWNTEGVNAVFLSGDDLVATQFVEKLKREMPGVVLLTDSAASAQHNASSEKSPNPYDGMITAEGYSTQGQFELPSFQACAKTYEDVIGQKVIAPDDLKAGPDGNKVEVYDAMEVACEDFTFFKYVADKVGTYLNNQNWVNTINNLGDIDNVIPGTHYASIHTGKYDADDDSGLASFDEKIEDFKLTTPVVNARSS